MSDFKIPPSVWSDISKANRIVIKIGTKSLLLDDGSFDFKTIASVVQDIKFMVKNTGKQVVLVTSGAVSAGMKKLGMKARPKDVVMQQVAASVGNPLLLNVYIRLFDEMPVAQVLLTQQDLSSRKSYLHFLNTMDRLLQERIVPIVNENDVVSIDELVDTRKGEKGTEYNFSDNDVLSALVAASIGAQLLIILSDVDGLYTKHPNSPKAEFVSYVQSIDDEIRRMGKEGSKYGKGGMITKLRAAEICMLSGVWMVIANAKKTNLVELISRANKCTVFKPMKKLPDKHLWMIFAANVEGKLLIDDGAIAAIQKGASILLPGIVKCEGDFQKGDVVEVLNESKDKVICKGIVNYSSQEIARFMDMYRQSPNTFKKQGISEIMHRDKMALPN
ncbi:MAG: glutamate 5-kinase [Promethearchaeota archaeon]